MSGIDHFFRQLAAAQRVFPLPEPNEPKPSPPPEWVAGTDPTADLILWGEAWSQKSAADKRRAIVRAYRTGLYLRKDKVAFAKFKVDRFWADKKCKRKDAVRLCLLRMLGNDRRSAQTASLYWRAVRGFAEQSVSPQGVYDALRKNTIRGCARGTKVSGRT